MKETKFKQTEVGMIPSDWDLIPIGLLAKDMADGPFGSNLKKEHYTKDPQVRIIQLSNIGEDGWVNENTKYTTFEHAKTIARCIVPNTESILVAKMMPAGRAILCPHIDKQYILGSDVIRITANNKLNSKYFVYASKSTYYLQQIADNTQGSTRQRTSISKLKNISVPLPTIEEQKRIAQALSDVDAVITTTEKIIAKKKALKQGTMQQLLSGKKRLPNFTMPWKKVKMKEGLSFQAGFPFESRFFNENNIGMRIIRNRDLKSNRDIVFFSGSIPEDYIVKNGDILIGMDGDFLPCKWAAGPALLNQRVGRLIFKGNWHPTFFYYILYKPLVEKQDTTGATTVKHLSHKDVENMEMVIPSDPKEQTAIATVLSDMDSEIAALETKLAKYRTLKTGMMQQLLTGKIRLV